MDALIRILVLGAAFCQLSLGAPSSAGQENCNTSTNRACWISGTYDINTDYESNTPLTGVVRKYSLTLTEEDNWVGPDGVTKEKVMLVNGNIIGPTIYAQWGDTISVSVTNNLINNGTTIHWHGMRQLNTNLQDGVNGVTECPISPNGGSRAYTFIARQYGTSWYHSHFSAQYGNGIVGPIQIDGPASLPYDVDLGPLILSDYYYKTADEIFDAGGAPPASDNVLINGSQPHPVSGEGSYHNISFEPGKRHRLRIINTSVENHFQVSISNHTMTIIGSDLVPVNSFTTDSLFVGVGQRYDVTVDASQAIDNYWLNVTFGGGNSCGASNNPYPASIVHYDGASNSNPTYAGVAPIDHQCLDLLNLTPVVARTVPTTGFTASADNSLDVEFSLTTGKWTINSSSLAVDWSIPVAQLVLNNQTDWLPSNNVWQVDEADTWAFWLIQNDLLVALPHPIHLHGHDFVVLGRSPDTTAATPTLYNFTASDISSLRGNNPLRRDVTMLPPGGWIVIAFKTDNPGAWLMHCHIAWHASGGLGVTFLERASDYRAAVEQADVQALQTQCSEWNDYYPTDIYQQGDSGI